MNADDVIFTFERQWKKDNPYYAVSGGNYEYFNGMSMPELLDRIEKGRRLYSQVLPDPGRKHRCWRTWGWILQSFSRRNMPTQC